MPDILRDLIVVAIALALAVFLCGCDEDSRPSIGYHAPPARAGELPPPPPPAPWMVRR